MKNAYVLEHHFGDNGNVSEGMILKGISQKRFDALERRKLVREATAAEVKKGFKAPFTASGTVTAGEEPDAPEGDAEPDAPEGDAEPGAPEGGGEPGATEGDGESGAPEGGGEPGAPEGGGEPGATEGDGETDAPEGGRKAARTPRNEAAPQPENK